MLKKYAFCVLPMIGLTGSYLVLRYPLFFLHGMKQWPLALFLAGVIIVVISGLVLSRKILPLFTLAGYVVGFIFGCIFQFDYGPDYNRLNSFWMIWTCIYFAAILAGIAAEVICSKRKAN